MGYHSHSKYAPRNFKVIYTVIGGDPNIKSSSSSKKEAASWVEIPKSPKALSDGCLAGGLGAIGSCAGCARGRFVSGGWASALVANPLRLMAGYAGIERGFCDGVSDEKSRRGLV
jgi:hypothetical protein